MSFEPKKILQLNEPIQTVQEGDEWVARLPLLGIEVRRPTHDEAQQWAFHEFMDRLRDMPDPEGDEWFAANTSPASVDELPPCSLPGDPQRN